jgi:hypothetical protein
MEAKTTGVNNYPLRARDQENALSACGGREEKDEVVGAKLRLHPFEKVYDAAVDHQDDMGQKLFCSGLKKMG